MVPGSAGVAPQLRADMCNRVRDETPSSTCQRLRLQVCGPWEGHTCAQLSAARRQTAAAGPAACEPSRARRSQVRRSQASPRTPARRPSERRLGAL